MSVYKKIDLEQGSKEWLLWRSLKIGASDISNILSDDYWGCNVPLWNKKMGLITEEINEAMQHGKDEEAKARDFLNKKMSTNYQPICIESIAHDWMVASIDGFDESQEIKGIEIKCPFLEKNHKRAEKGTIPVQYREQMQHQMICSGENKWLFVSFFKDDIISIVVEKDLEMEKKILEYGFEFYKSIINYEHPTYGLHQSWINYKGMR